MWGEYAPPSDFSGIGIVSFILLRRPAVQGAADFAATCRGQGCHSCDPPIKRDLSCSSAHCCCSHHGIKQLLPEAYQTWLNVLLQTESKKKNEYRNFFPMHNTVGLMDRGLVVGNSALGTPVFVMGLTRDMVL